MSIKASVIVTTYKAHQHLVCCIKSLCRLSEGCKNDLEVVIYGDGGGAQSKDALGNCEEILAAAGIKCLAKYEDVNIGLVMALNAACDLASGEWLYIVNDDMVFPYDWWNRTQKFLKPHRVLSTSALEPLTPFRKPARCFRAANLGFDPVTFNFDEVDKLQIEAPLEIGVNYPFFVEKSLFNAVGKADSAFPGPYHDPDLFHRFRLAGADLVRTQNLAPYHFSGISLRQQNSGALPSLNWVRRENEARLVFIHKWGCKPKARFGDIPRVKNNVLWKDQSKSLTMITQFALLLLWENFRCFWRILVLRFRIFFKARV